MKAKDFMSVNVICCSQDDTVKDAAQLMWDRKFSVVPVVDNNQKLVGIVTESDFIGKDVDVPHALGSIKGLLGELYLPPNDMAETYAMAKSKKLSEVMTKNPIFVSPESTLNEIGYLMEQRNLKRIPVVDAGKIVGIITRKDLLNAFLKISGSP